MMMMIDLKLLEDTEDDTILLRAKNKKLFLEYKKLFYIRIINLLKKGSIVTKTDFNYLIDIIKYVDASKHPKITKNDKIRHKKKKIDLLINCLSTFI